MKKQLLLLVLLVPFGLSAQINTFPYTEDFESGAGGWAPVSIPSFEDNSWILGTPDFTVINQAAPGGTMSWYVDTTDFQTSEYSHVLSPVFDFSSLSYPTVSLDIWWDLVTNVDGAVFQSSIDGGSSWQNVGHHDDNNLIGTNWYNHAFLSEGFPNGGAGLQQISHWTGDSLQGSQGWVTASHFLEGLAGESNVLFRFAWANRGGNANRPANGVAFDNVQIFEGTGVDLTISDVSQAGPCGGGYPGVAMVTVQNLGAGAATFNSFQDSLGTDFSFGQVTIQGFSSAEVLVQLPLQNPGDTTLNVGVVHQSDQNPANNFATGSFNCNVINGLNHCNDFENDSVGTWFVDPEGINSSWNLGGNATNNTINTPSSSASFWGTTGPDGGYNPNEQSSILSPFFDFSNLQNSGVSIQLWTDLETDYDGGVLQYSIDGGATWFNVGTQGSGTNWYNAGALMGGGAGGQNVANWNGSTGGWVNASNATPMLDGASNVLFRVSLGADDIFQDGGLGIDDFCTTGEATSVADTFNIVINEVKGYLNDTAYTVELLNKESFDVNLVGYELRIYDDTDYETYNLTGSISGNGYLLVHFLYNGSIANISHNYIWLENASNVLLDGLSLNSGGGPSLDPSEGSFDQTLDTSLYRSISRIPNGQDTDDNSVDFKLVCPTLGSANMDDQISCGPPLILINEVDAQPGSSGYTIELFNKSLFDADLGGYIIQVYDGSSLINQTLSGTITGEGYMLVPINFANADISQNTINLFDSSENFLDQVTLNNGGATLNEVQGSFNELDLYVTESISRIPNGQDTDDNAVDFKIVCRTLGSENIDTLTCEPEGIAEARELRLMLFPNPANDFIILDIGSPESFSINVSDAMGRTSKITRTSNHGKIEVSELIPGVYSIVATDSNGKSAVGRFIKQ